MGGCGDGKGKSALARYSGYLLLVLLYFGWFRIGLDPGPLAVLSVFAFSYTLFVAPVPCSAKNRNGTFCRENAYGLLRDCYRQQHKWQNAFALVNIRAWVKRGMGFLDCVKTNVAVLVCSPGRCRLSPPWCSCSSRSNRLASGVTAPASGSLTVPGGCPATRGRSTLRTGRRCSPGTPVRTGVQVW